MLIHVKSYLNKDAKPGCNFSKGTTGILGKALHKPSEVITDVRSCVKLDLQPELLRDGSFEKNQTSEMRTEEEKKKKTSPQTPG